MSKFKSSALLKATTQETQGLQTPNDLMSIPEFCLKHCFDYDYIYKLSVQKGIIKVYLRGVWKVSEGEVFAYINNLKDKKLSKIQARKGGN